MNIIEIAEALETTQRVGAERDVPEGACYIQISDTLARMMAQILREHLRVLAGIANKMASL